MKIVPILLLAVVLLFPGGCKDKEKNPYSGPMKKVTVSTGMLELELSGLLWLAKSQRYFRQNGLDVTINKMPSGAMALKALQQGEIDFSASGEFPFVVQSSASPGLRICASIARCNFIALLGRKDKGILKISDVKGKRLGLHMKTQLEFMLGKFLSFHGMTLQDVEPIDVHIKDIPDALIKGDIDAGLIVLRQFEKFNAGGAFDAVKWNLQQGDENFYILASNLKLIEKEPETIERFLRALESAEKFHRKNPAQAINAISSICNIPRKNLDISLPKMRYELALPMALLIAMEDECRWLIENQMIGRETVPIFLDFMYFNALESVHPDRVGIVH